MAIERNYDNDLTPTDDEFAALANIAADTSNAAKTASAVFKMYAKQAAETIVDLALRGVNERVRLDAAKYVTERVMGRIGDAKDLGNDGGAPWDGVYKATVIREPAAAERAKGATISPAR